MLLFEQSEAAQGKAMPVEMIARVERAITLLQFDGPSARGLHGAAAPVAERASDVETEAAARSAQISAMIEAAREQARSEADIEWEGRLEVRLREERVRVEQVCGEFARDRERYFAAAEGQVVRLALAMARRVLSREVVADTMHMTATVRAALARVRDEERPVLRVRPGELHAWEALFEGAAERRVLVSADERLRAGHCELETKVGRVELGVESQMNEIERGFAEMMQRA